MKPHTPVQLASVKEDGLATIYIYGYIGQRPEWYLDPEDRSEEITAMALIKELNAAVAQGCQRVNIRINSVGGSVYEGEAMVAAIRECSAEVHTYNDGLVASMASTIWLAGHHRHMASNAKMMIHAVRNGVFGTSKDLRREADVVDKFDQASIASISGYTNMSEDEVREAFFADYEDHWLVLSDVTELGLVSSGETYRAADTVPTAVQHLSYTQLLKEYQPQRPEAKRPSFIQRLRQNITGTSQQADQSPDPVNIDTLRQALKDGLLTPEDLDAVQQEQETTPAPEQKTTPDLGATITAAVQAATAPMQETITSLQQQVRELGDQPGAQPTAAGGEQDPDSSKPNLVRQDAERYAHMAQSGVNPFTRNLHPVVAPDAE